MKELARRFSPINWKFNCFKVAEGKLPMNHQITYLLQDIFNLVPDLTTTSFVKSINVNTNDQMLVIYAASLIRSIIALHNLINNKLTNKEAERKEAGGSSKESATKKETEKEKSEKAEKAKDGKDTDKGEKSKSDKK